MTLLAAIVYRHGAPVEAMFDAVLKQLRAAGDLRVGGAVPCLGGTLSNGRAAMLMQDLQRGDRIDISQDLGAGSTGCILLADGLATLRVRIGEAIAAAPDVLLLGRFGKEEANGRGIREEIAQAVVAGIPTIVAVEERLLPGWTAFTAGAFTALPDDPAGVVAWVRQVTRHHPETAATLP